MSITLENANIKLREPKGSPWPHYFLAALHVLLLAAPPFRHRRAVANIGTGVLMALCWRHPNFTTDFAVAQPFSIAWSTYMATLEKITLLPAGQTPETSFWRVDKPAHEATGYGAFSLSKIRWALTLIFNMRGIRWNHEIKNVPALPASQTLSRLRFTAWRLAAAAYYLFMADLASHAMVLICYTDETSLLRGDVNSKYLRIWDDRSLVWSFVRALTFGVQPYYMLQMQYTVFSIVAVATTASRPADWPPQFGRLSETTSVRAFWGSYWHQTLRRMFESWMRAARDWCGFRQGTWQSRYIQLWLSFIMSGLGHAASVLILPSPKNITFQERTEGLLLFFLWQAFIITIEDGIKHVWNQWLGGPRAKDHVVPRVAGYIWVIGMLWFSMGWAGDVFLRMRLAEEPLFGSSPSGAFLETWIPMIRKYLVSS
ncbi:membrane bound O-acyl transferase family-domain-containing protein [Xylariaceae sp. FL0255]|nr:membrane bound O-acyl transferase family-domain-containing protein [Xylariaceae sp. FL0255]